MGVEIAKREDDGETGESVAENRLVQQEGKANAEGSCQAFSRERDNVRRRVRYMRALTCNPALMQPTADFALYALCPRPWYEPSCDPRRRYRKGGARVRGMAVKGWHWRRPERGASSLAGIRSRISARFSSDLDHRRSQSDTLPYPGSTRWQVSRRLLLLHIDQPQRFSG